MNELIQALQLIALVGVSLLPVIGVVVLFHVGYKRFTGRSTRLGPAADGVFRAMNAGVFPASLRTVQYEPGPELSDDWAGDDLDLQPDAQVTTPRRRIRRSDRLRRSRD